MTYKTTQKQAENTTCVLYKYSIIRKIKIICLIVSGVFLSSCSMGLRHSELIDGTITSYVLEGKGKPTVIFESGLGDGFWSWAPIFEQVTEFSSAVAYNRSGYTGHVPGRTKKQQTSANDVAHHLHKLLKRINVDGPYILVGHSIGGMYVLRFAKLFPGKVVGIVLVDGRPKDFSRKCMDAGLSPCKPPPELTATLPYHIAAEIRGIELTEKQTPSPEELGSIAVSVIAATEPPPGSPKGSQPIWLMVQKKFADRLNKGHYVIAEGSGHYIHKDNPELVIQEIRKMVEQYKLGKN